MEKSYKFNTVFIGKMDKFMEKMEKSYKFNTVFIGKMDKNVCVCVEKNLYISL